MLTEQRPILSGFNDHSTAREVIGDLRLDGKTILITGGHSGIGLESSKVLAEHGAQIIVGARNVAKAQRELAKVASAEVFPLDLSVPASITQFAAQVLAKHPRIDVLMNNAGIMALPDLQKDARGIELQFATNHLGHFQLTTLMWTALKDAGNARVVNLSSYGHRFSPVQFDDINFDKTPYNKWVAYGQSKTANVLFTVTLDKLGSAHGIRSFAVHPGRIPATNLKRHMTWKEVLMMPLLRFQKVYIKNIAQGAATQVWATTSAQLAGLGGVYCADCDLGVLVHADSPLPNSIRDYALDETAAARLWALSETLTRTEFPK